MIPRTFPSIVEAFQTKMVVYVVPSITGLKAWIDYIPVKGVVTESATLANTYANGGYQVVKSLDSLTGLQAWIGYIPVYEDALYNKPWSTDAGGYIPVGGLFSIPSLFASGAPGVWYDPSDYGATGTLFQDSAGTTPVTAVEQPVGLMLDKSQGLVLGPELVTNGDFSGGTTTGWTPVGASLSASTGALVLTNTVAYGSATQTFSVTAGKWYQVAATPAAGTANPTTRMGSAPFTYDYLGQTNSAAPISRYFYATTSTVYVYLVVESASVGATASFDNISVRELAGNHAFQATSASRPVLSARYNLLTKTEQFDDAAWTKTGSTTVQSNVAIAPDGTTTADELTLGASGAVRQIVSVVASSTAVWVKAAASGSATHIRISTNNASAWGTGYGTKVALTSEWQRISAAGSVTGSTSTSLSIGVLIPTDGSNDPDCYGKVLIWGASLVPANQSTLPYQRVNTATDYATTGFLPYLKFDGVDDSLSTNSISFTSTDKMSVFAGVRKLSDAAAAILAELSAVASTNNGAFYVATPDSPATYGFGLRGTTSINRNASTYTAPITNVLAASFDIAQATPATELSIRINAATPGTIVNGGASDAGTGNFGNYPLYIGRRNNATLPFNGQLYSMIIVGKAVTAGELSSTETYVNQKTGAY